MVSNSFAIAVTYCTSPNLCFFKYTHFVFISHNITDDTILSIEQVIKTSFP